MSSHLGSCSSTNNTKLLTMQSPSLVFSAQKYSFKRLQSNANVCDKVRRAHAVHCNVLMRSKIIV